VRTVREPKRIASRVLGCGLLAVLSEPAFADSGWGEVQALLIGITCLILIIATTATIFATRAVAIGVTLLVAAGMSWMLAGEVTIAALDIWALFLACFVVLAVACLFKLWRWGKGTDPPPPSPPNTSLERTRER
jgi:hypothetical protein